MLPDQIEKLRQELTDRYVMVNVDRPELARFQGLVGQVKTINFNGRALVQFEPLNPAWFDIELDYLRVVEKPSPPPERQPPAKPPAP